MLKWEDIKHDNVGHMARAQVHGGWLVKISDDVMTQTNQGYTVPIPEIGHEWRSSITFVPDPKHQWII